MKAKDLLDRIQNKDRSALSQAITLIESSKLEHRNEASKLLEFIIPLSGGSKRIGISGTPGVGKSTFIESFGRYLISQGESVAVLAVDPTSYLSGGSILGDKTRMPTLSTDQNAYVRPSPSSRSLGGVAKSTKEAMLLCEAFGFDNIIIETVGVGQSEVTVSNLVDHFMLLMQPGSGDELQGIKRGILELADSIIVNKADGDLLVKAKIAKAELESSVHILRKEKFPILLCSALKNENIDLVYNSIQVFFKDRDALSARRLVQNKNWLESLIQYDLLNRIHTSQKLKDKISEQLETNKSILKMAKEILDEIDI